MLKPIALIFDVNRTILIEDRAAGKTREDEIASILAACCFGRVSEDKKSWTPQLDHPLQYEPREEGFVSYYHFVQEILYPFPEFADDISKEVRHKTISDIKDNRRALLKSFFHEGHPGIGWIEEYHKMVKATEQPEGFTLLPSFYETISYFQKQQTPISLCFRTFGIDIENVLYFRSYANIWKITEEWNSFCDGKHPEYSNFVQRHLKLTKENTGTFFRSGPRSEDCHLIMGTIQQPKILEGMEFYSGMNVKIFHGFQEINKFLQQKYREQSVIAIRDYYPWILLIGLIWEALDDPLKWIWIIYKPRWASQGEKFNSGKLFFVGDEVTNPESTRIRQFFFDDNLWLNEFRALQKLIVDVRDADTGESHADIASLFGKACIQAQPLYAITQKHYFIDHVNCNLRSKM